MVSNLILIKYKIGNQIGKIMKKKYQFYLAITVFLFQISCSTTKDIAMFQESEKDLNQLYIPDKPQENKIKPYDNLYISITTLDPEVNKLFNPSSAGEGMRSGTEQMYGSPASQYINGYRVSADSTVVLPILGKINFVGLSLDEAQERLKTRAEEYLKEPSVHVKFLNFKVNIIGEIHSPGVFYNYEGSLNILDAIGWAKGITDFADLRNVVVKREQDNRIATYNINLTDNSVYNSEAFYLKPNDLVYVPPSNLKRRSTNSDTYGKLLGTISTLLVAVALFLRY